MAYATIPDVQARFPQQVLLIGPSSSPSQDQISQWLDQQSAWVESTFAWKYNAPFTDANDLVILKPIVAMLVAAQAWEFMAGHDPVMLNVAESLRRQAFDALGYKGGRSGLVLSVAALSDTGEAAIGQPISTFTDPTVEGNDARMFSIGMEL